MNNPHVILCGGQSLPKGIAGSVLRLNAWASRRKAEYVGLKIEDLHTKLFKPVPRQFEDLMDIATYVYCADQATSRGGKDVDSFGGNWRRQFHFHIPVREPDLWNTKEVKQTLIETLQFLSDDYYDFTFTAAGNPPGMQGYFSQLQKGGTVSEPQQVVMFSGGLDSLAGAVVESVVEKRRIILVTHRPTDKLNNIHRNLESMLAEKAGSFAPAHLHVRINKKSELNKSYLQRARSFLYVTIGATVAEMLGQNSVRFYENGVVSLNLPVSAEVVGSRATRTTHPKVLEDYGRLLRLVAGHAFTVENPFIWNTKTEVIEKILKAGCGDLIGASVSCAHTFSFSNEHPHCGTCSQCIDRRFGILAAGAEVYDPLKRYARDVITGTRPIEEDRMMVALYLERAKRVANLKTAGELISQFPDVTRTFKYLKEGPLAAAERTVALHQRHGKEVKSVLADMVARHKDAIADNSLESDCLLTIAVDSGHAKTRVEPTKKPFQEEQEKRWEKEKLSPKTCRLEKGLGFWRVIFKGEEVIVRDDRGMALIVYLLKNPTAEPVHATKLEVLVDGVATGTHLPGADTGGIVQEATGRKLNDGRNTILKSKLIQLQEAINDATLSEGEREKAREEQDQLLHHASHAPKLPTQAGRVADRVRKAIWRMIDELQGTESKAAREFGKHLDVYIWRPSVGVGGRRVGASGKPGCYTYERPAGVIWRG